jgi:hypothetical protein
LKFYEIVKEYKCQIPEGKVGDWSVEKFEVTEQDAELERIRSMFSFGSRGRGVPEGHYTKLKRNGFLVMSDTPDEIADALPFLYQARGHVLINGLGLGTTVDLALLREDVEHVTVIEISPEVIELVGKHLLEKHGEYLDIIQADALTWKAPKGKRYGAVWHDIWDDICEDNLPDMHTLHRKYGRRCDWQGSWCRERIEWMRGG